MLRVTIPRFYSPQCRSSGTDNLVGQLQICIIEAEGLPQVDYIGGAGERFGTGLLCCQRESIRRDSRLLLRCSPADPYCTVGFSQYDHRQIKQTPFIPSTTDPRWSAYFTFKVHSFDDLSRDLELYVYDRDKYGDDRLIGKVVTALGFWVELPSAFFLHLCGDSTFAIRPLFLLTATCLVQVPPSSTLSICARLEVTFSF
eukprot:SAG31_NODE_18008_length_650_cov_0.564428_1_plen_199_part_01